jgi:murein DD-endopeptidase MepM/ murein hydrolase activator NlpD
VPDSLRRDLKILVLAAAGLATSCTLVSAQPAAATLPPPVWPACISSPFGSRKLPGPHAAGFHNGVDFPAREGAPVYAVAPGKVVEIRRLGSSGLEIDLLHDADPSHRFVSRYAHLGTVAPKLADGRRQVARGEVLGRVGRSGITYGTHLHFEVRVGGKPIDPEPYFSVVRCNTLAVGE